MPLPNEHVARIQQPDKYDRLRRQNDAFGEGIHVIYGIKDEKSEVQSIHFDAKKFTPEEAKQWLKVHEYEPIEFEPATKGEESVTTITIYGEVGFEVQAKDIVPQILGANGDVEMRIHSPGGDVSDGLAIANVIREEAKSRRVRCVVDGMAGSIASVIACAGTELVMHRNAFLVIHNPTAFLMQGDAESLRRNAETLDKIKQQIVDILRTKIDRSPDEIFAMLDEETFIFGSEAAQYGLKATVLEDDVTAAAIVGRIRYRNLPARAAALYRCEADPKQEAMPEQEQKPESADEMKKRIRELEEENAALRAELERLKKEATDPVDLSRQLERVRNEARKHQALADKLTAEMAKLKKTHDEEVGRLKAEMAECRRREKAAVDRLSQVSMQVFFVDPKVDSWQDALRACGGDPSAATIAPDVYLAFRRRFPQFFDLWNATRGAK